MGGPRAAKPSPGACQHRATRARRLPVLIEHTFRTAGCRHALIAEGAWILAVVLYLIAPGLEDHHAAQIPLSRAAHRPPPKHTEHPWPVPLPVPG